MTPQTLKEIQQLKIDDALISKIVRMIVDAFNPKRIILFGSRAEGKERPDSDVDLLVEMEAFADEPRWKRRIRVDQLFGLRWWPMDILVYTPEELAQRRNSLASIAPVVEQEGKVLYERAVKQRDSLHQKGPGRSESRNLMPHHRRVDSFS